jgi:hypothetical protein
MAARVWVDPNGRISKFAFDMQNADLAAVGVAARELSDIVGGVNQFFVGDAAPIDSDRFATVSVSSLGETSTDDAVVEVNSELIAQLNSRNVFLSRQLLASLVVTSRKTETAPLTEPGRRGSARARRRPDANGRRTKSTRNANAGGSEEARPGDREHGDSDQRDSEQNESELEESEQVEVERAEEEVDQALLTEKDVNMTPEEVAVLNKKGAKIITCDERARWLASVKAGRGGVNDFIQMCRSGRIEVGRNERLKVLLTDSEGNGNWKLRRNLVNILRKKLISAGRKPKPKSADKS